jgi:hypothetical protein
MTAAHTPAAPAITDVVIIVDTERSKGDRLVLRLDAEGEPTAWMACGATQLQWMINDADYYWPAAWSMGRHPSPDELAEPEEGAPDGTPPDGLAEALVLLASLTPDGRRALIARCNAEGVTGTPTRRGFWARVFRRGGETP